MPPVRSADPPNDRSGGALVVPSERQLQAAGDLARRLLDDRRVTGSAGPAQPTTVLIVDDMVETREVLRRLLDDEADIEVVGTAGDADAAVERARELQPRVILLDHFMPGGHGFEAMGRLFEVSPGSDITAMSVMDGSAYLRAAMLGGAREYLVKPFSREDLLGSVRAAAARPQPVSLARDGLDPEDERA